MTNKTEFMQEFEENFDTIIGNVRTTSFNKNSEGGYLISSVFYAYKGYRLAAQKYSIEIEQLRSEIESLKSSKPKYHCPLSEKELNDVEYVKAYIEGCAESFDEFASRNKELERENESLKLSDKCWRFVSHKDFIRTRGYDTDGDWRGISVGIQKSHLTSVKSAILGKGQTLKDAVLNAVKKWDGS